MIKRKRDGFTLSEVLITLSIVGILAILVLPGLIKDTNNKAMMANLQSSVSTLNNAVQNEILSKGARTIDDTNIKSNPEEFLQTLDIMNLSKTDIFADSYKSLSGNNIAKPQSLEAGATLKNGVAVGLKTYKSIISSALVNNNSSCTIVYLDINGKNPPNIVGVDLFALKLSWTNLALEASDMVQHFGELGAFPGGTIGATNDNATIDSIKTKCKNGDPAACYYLAERTSFDPNYIETAE